MLAGQSNIRYITLLYENDEFVIYSIIRRLYVIYGNILGMCDSQREVIERSVKQLNTYGNGIGVLITREAKAPGLKSGSKVQVSAVKCAGKEYIVIEKFPLKEG